MKPCCAVIRAKLNECHEHDEIISKIRDTLDRFKNAFAAFAVTKKRGAVGLVVPSCNLLFDLCEDTTKSES